MRYYLISSDGNEVVFDINKSHKLAFGYYEYEVNHPNYTKKLRIKKLAGKFFLSEDGVSWRKVAVLELDKTIAHRSKTYQVYRGFKPSGLFSADAGSLISQMPGKVIKIMTSNGQQVEKGETLIILEAMKMENEIKAGINGKVKNIHVKEGQALEAGQLMIEIEV